MKMTVNTKLNLLGVLMVVTISILVFMQHSAINTIVELEQEEVEVIKVEASMLSLRRNEKDFLARKDLKYFEKFEANYQVIQELVADLATRLEDSGLNSTKAQAMTDVLLEYQSKFIDLVEVQQKIGLHSEDGLYGNLRKAAHNVENTLKQQNDYQLMIDMLTLRRNEKDFMLRSDLKYLGKFEKNLTAFKSNLIVSNIPENEKSVIANHLTKYRSNFIALTEGYKKKGLNSKEGLLGEMRTSIHKSENILKEMESEVLAEVNAHVSLVESTLIVVSIVLTVLVIVLVALITRSIIRPINDVSKVMHDACDNKDLRVRTQLQGNNEITAMAKVFNTMTGEFQELIQQALDSSRKVKAESDELQAITERTNKGMSRQLAESEQVATAITEMSATVQEVARNAADAATASNTADTETAKGKEQVALVSKGIQSLAEEVENSAHTIEELEKESENIGSVLGVIQSIAEQTNLLALNAAIEAARAGESGRGFAVVADEVRTLAQRSQESTEEIKTIIDRLQAGAKASVQAMEIGRTQARVSVEQAQTASISLDAIARAVEITSDMNIQIASAAEEQSAVADEISRSVVNITQVADETAESSRHTTDASGRLAKFSLELQQYIGQFKV